MDQRSLCFTALIRLQSSFVFSAESELLLPSRQELSPDLTPVLGSDPRPQTYHHGRLRLSCEASQYELEVEV